MILVNFKIYEETWGDKAVELAKICKKVSNKTQVKIVPVVSALDAGEIMMKTNSEVWLQDVDEIFEGAATGSISPIKAKSLGVGGTLLNHSERRKKPGTIKKMLSIWPKGFKVAVCLNSLGQAEGWARNIKADYIAYEPKYLIGNKDKSVATERPEIIKKMVKNFPKIPILVGAGIHSPKDVKISLKLGAAGILISSYIVKSDRAEERLMELAKCF
ncbi:MAG TPA: triose-phosphate isomerase [Candidatus Woesebacteria bacterium]|jgi:triosephosphate isomerase|nr:triose-phosphate isomerase [Candidatus Shapirobacteria bacterium]HOR01796.1 triose-phosphate isomerase [Candidatus Woesebacteria bacterium]